MNYLQEAKQIVSTCLFVPIEKIEDDATLNSVQPLDSLSFEMIVVEIEKRTKTEIDPVELLSLTSIKDLAGILERYTK